MYNSIQGWIMDEIRVDSTSPLGPFGERDPSAGRRRKGKQQIHEAAQDEFVSSSGQADGDTGAGDYYSPSAGNEEPDPSGDL